MSDARSRKVTGAVLLGSALFVGLPWAYYAHSLYDSDEPDPPPPVASAPSASALPLPTAPPSVSANPGPVSARRCTLAGISPRDPAASTSGGAVARAPMGHMLAVADADNSKVTVLSVQGDSLRVERELSVGAAPAQVLVATDGRVLVAERGANTVSVYDPRSGEKLCTAPDADDPFGLAVSPDERTLYVTSALAHTLTVLDAETLATRATLDLPREPRGVVVSPDGATLFVSHVAGSPMSAVDLAGPMPTLRALPPLPATASPSAPALSTFGDIGVGRTRDFAFVSGPTPTANPLPSQAWAPVFDPSQQAVFVPFMRSRTGREIPAEARLDRYGGGSVTPENDKVELALARWDTRTAQWSEQRLPSSARGRIPVAAVRRASDGALLVLSQATAQVLTVRVGSGPGSVPPDAIVANSEADTIGRIGMRRARGVRGFPVTEALATAALPTGLAALDDGAVAVFSQAEHALQVHRAGRPVERISLGGETLAEDVARGRRLFHDASDARIASGGLSCAGCHPDGRDDGLVWFLSQGPRQTPTLVGRLTPPFNWNGSHPTIEGNVAQTVTRLGGTGLPLRDVDALAAYVSRGLRAPTRTPVRESYAVEEGRRVFATTANCGGCHDPGRNFTDGAAHELGGLGRDERVPGFDTPSLRYVASTAPYFHDGRYPTLRAVLTDPTHHMGRIEGLSPPQVDALEAYLRTL